MNSAIQIILDVQAYINTRIFRSLPLTKFGIINRSKLPAQVLRQSDVNERRGSAATDEDRDLAEEVDSIVTTSRSCER